MIKRLVLTVLVLEGIFFSPSDFSWSQSVDTDAASQIQKLSQQSQKYIDEYKAKKKNIEAELRQKLRTLTNSPADRLRRRQWVQESNQKLRLLQEEFTLEMDSIGEAKNKLIHPGSDGPAFVRPAPRPRAISDEELKAKINQQDELFRQEKERGNPMPREPFPVDQNTTENNLQPPAVSDENSPNKSTPKVLFPPADKESPRESNVNTY